MELTWIGSIQPGTGWLDNPQVFSVDGFLLTFAGAADPKKIEAAFELEKIAPYIDWFVLIFYILSEVNIFF